MFQLSKYLNAVHTTVWKWKKYENYPRIIYKKYEIIEAALKLIGYEKMLQHTYCDTLDEIL